MHDLLVCGIASIPTVSSGMFLNNHGEFELNLNIRKYYGDMTKKSNYLWRSDCKSSVLMDACPDVKFRSISPDGAICLIGRGDKNSKLYLEIWKNDSSFQFSTCVNVSSLHGDYCTDDVFGSFSWSPTGDSFIYVAEKLESQDSQSSILLSKYLDKENFGERLQDVRMPAMFILNVKTLQVTEMKVSVESSYKIFPAQPVFIDEENIVFMGIPNLSKQLGMTYIFCRPTSIFSMRLSSKKAKLISDPRWSCRSPIVSMDGSKISYLRNSIGKSHFKSSQLVLFNVSDSSESILVDIVKDPKAGFPGIFCQRIPAQRFNSNIYLTTCCYDYKNAIRINVTDASIINIFPDFLGSMRILDIRAEALLAVGSTAIDSGRVFIFSKHSEVSEIKIHPISDNEMSKSIANQLESSVMEVNSLVHIVLLQPKQRSGKVPLIIVPHGGPNSVYSVDYVFYPTVLAMLGFAVASINYTGSIGFGDNSIESLEGQIGTRDVEDCYLSLMLLLKTDVYDSGQVIVMGGSHGGYLTAFLSAIYPKLFKAAILRNPVIDLLSMSVTSDISDWTFGQLGLDYYQMKGRCPNTEELRLFYERSPSSYYHAVECKTLIMLGAMDLRVSPTQGKYWAQLLKGSLGDDKCLLYVFPDANHSLETAESERFGLQIILEFLNN